MHHTLKPWAGSGDLRERRVRERRGAGGVSPYRGRAEHGVTRED
jgi:hypothetical protein